MHTAPVAVTQLCHEDERAGSRPIGTSFPPLPPLQLPGLRSAGGSVTRLSAYEDWVTHKFHDDPRSEAGGGENCRLRDQQQGQNLVGQT